MGAPAQAKRPVWAASEPGAVSYTHLFQNESGELDRRDLARLERLHYVTDIYLKAVKDVYKRQGLSW